MENIGSRNYIPNALDPVLKDSRLEGRRHKSRIKSRKRAIARAREIEKKKVRFSLINISLSIILIIVLSVGYTDMVSISNNIGIIQMDNDDLNIEIDSLENTLKPLMDSNRIEKIARNKLQMVYPSDKNLVSIDNYNSRFAEKESEN